MSRPDAAERRLLYARFASELDAPLFQQGWWLDALCGEEGWDASLAAKGGQVQAGLAFACAHGQGRLRLDVLGMPLGSHFLGPLLRPSRAKPAKALAREHDLLAELIEGLPDFHVFEQIFSPDVGNWLPFRWKGFEQTTNYTYVLATSDGPEALWAGLQENVRTDVKKAKNRFGLKVRSLQDPAPLIEACRATWHRQGKESAYDGTIRAMADACLPRGAGEILVAEDPQGRVHAAALILHDSRMSYYLKGGADPELRSSGAQSHLLWEAVLASAARGLDFDFVGSSVQSIERHFRAFGAAQTPLLAVRKERGFRTRLRRTLALWRA